MSDERDPRLGAALADLPVPEHGEQFWDDVQTRVTAEARLRRGVRRIARSRFGTLGPLLLAGVAAIVILVAVVSAGGEDDRDAVPDGRPDPVAGAPVPQMVTGTVTITGTGANDGRDVAQRWAVARAIDGSVAATDERTGMISAYDATTGRSAVITSAGARVETGLAPGRPDPIAETFAVNRDLEEFVVAAALTGSERVDETEVDGRPAWRYRGPVASNRVAVGGVDEIDATVDRTTGVMRRFVGRAGGRVVLRLTTGDFDVHDIVDRGRFTPDPPAGAEVRTTDRGFVRTTLDDLIPLGAIPPLGARDEVAGYRLDSVWVRSGDGDRTGPEGQNPPSRDVVSLRYSDGWRHVVVTLRRLVEAPDRWDDPFRREGQVFEDEASITLPADGAFPGATGALVLDPQTVPHLWAISCGGGCRQPSATGYVLTVAGAASTQRLLELADVARAG